MARDLASRGASAHVTAVRLRMVDPGARTDRDVEVHDAELHVATGLVATDVHARWQLDERAPRPVGHRVAVVVVDGERSRLHHHERLAGVAVPTRRRVWTERVLPYDRVRARM